MSFKILLYKYAPKVVITFLKKIHYLKKLRETTADSEEDLKLLKYFIFEGDQAFDIGANFGAYTKIMSQYAGKKGKVFSFEPIPETYGYLCNNIQKLLLENVTALNIALSDSSGKVKMEVPKFAEAGDNFYEARIVGTSDYSNKTFTVDCSTLDEIIKKYNSNPVFVKCDVEGHESFVFKGATRLLSEIKPVLFIEINENLNNASTETTWLLDTLTKAGYKLYIHENNQLRKWNGEQKINYYFLTDHHIEKYNKIILQ